MHREWPYLFQLDGVLTHFLQLHGIDLKEALRASLAMKLEPILKCLANERVKNKEIETIFTELTSASLEERQAKILAMLLLLVAHFKEERSLLIVLKEASFVNFFLINLWIYNTCLLQECATVADIEAHLSLTPCIIALGMKPISRGSVM